MTETSDESSEESQYEDDSVSYTNTSVTSLESSDSDSTVNTKKLLKQSGKRKKKDTGKRSEKVKHFHKHKYDTGSYFHPMNPNTAKYAVNSTAPLPTMQQYSGNHVNGATSMNGTSQVHLQNSSTPRLSIGNAATSAPQFSTHSSSVLSALKALQEKINMLEENLKNEREEKKNIESKYQSQVSELEKQIESEKQENLKLKKLNMKLKKKTDLVIELEQDLEEAKGKNKKLQDHIYQLIDIHKGVVEKTFSKDGTSYPTAQSLNNHAGDLCMKKKKKTRRSTVTSKSSCSRRPQSAHVMQSSGSCCRSSKAKTLPSSVNLSGPNRSMHQRLKRANLEKEIPFVLGNSHNTHNLNATTQKNLNVGTEFNKIREEEPYNYYGNTISTNLLDDIDPNKEIEQVIDELKQECSLLDTQYHELLGKMQRDPTGKSVDTETLKRMIDERERKSKQLTYLERYHKAVTDHITNSASPPRIRGALKRIKTLKLFREIKNLQNLPTRGDCTNNIPN